MVEDAIACCFKKREFFSDMSFEVMTYEVRKIMQVIFKKFLDFALTD
jgi:hypothetical protein